jgi:hypothetical protein
MIFDVRNYSYLIYNMNIFNCQNILKIFSVNKND